MMIGILYIFFSGRLKKSKKFPDPDAKIGYCSAKKRAFVGYRATIINGNEGMPILDYYLTPANRHDSKALPPLLFSMERHGILPFLRNAYGDNAYHTKQNLKWLEYFNIGCQLHSKQETGKHPKKPRSAKRKSRIRSKVETSFGILHENFNFGKTFVRGINQVKTEMALTFGAWNHFYIISWMVNQHKDRISLRKLFYEN